MHGELRLKNVNLFWSFPLSWITKSHGTDNMSSQDQEWWPSVCDY
jgi:hypothetical protein